MTQDNYRDRAVLCRNCREEFTLTAGEQRFYIQRGLNQPRRCPKCRTKKRQQQGVFGEQVVSVDAVSGMVLCRHCSRMASRAESLRTGQAVCGRCAREDPELPPTHKDDELCYEEWIEHLKKKQEIGHD